MRFSQKLVRVLGYRGLCLGPVGVINCTPVSALSFWVGLFPGTCGYNTWASLVAQTVKKLPAMWKTWVWSLVWEDTLEKGMETHSSILVENPLAEEPGRTQSLPEKPCRLQYEQDWATKHSVDVCVCVYIYIYIYGTDELTYRAQTEAQIQKMNLWT